MKIKLLPSDPRFSIVTIDKNRIATTKAGEICEVNLDCVVMFQSEVFTPEATQTFEINLEILKSEPDT